MSLFITDQATIKAKADLVGGACLVQRKTTANQIKGGSAMSQQ